MDLAVAASAPVAARKPQSPNDLSSSLTTFLSNLAVAGDDVHVGGVFDTAGTDG